MFNLNDKVKIVKFNDDSEEYAMLIGMEGFISGFEEAGHGMNYLFKYGDMDLDNEIVVMPDEIILIN